MNFEFIKCFRLESFLMFEFWIAKIIWSWKKKFWKCSEWSDCKWEYLTKMSLMSWSYFNYFSEKNIQTFFLKNFILNINFIFIWLTNLPHAPHQSVTFDLSLSRALWLFHTTLKLTPAAAQPNSRLMFHATQRKSFTATECILHWEREIKFWVFCLRPRI